MPGSTDLEKGPKEAEILRAFIDSGVLAGEWYLEVPVGLECAKRGYFGYVAREKKASVLPEETEIRMFQGVFRESVDAVCAESPNKMIHPRYRVKHYLRRYVSFDEKTVWLIEAKQRLNHKALGQVLNYRDLFEEDWKARVRGIGVVCGIGNDMLEGTFKKLGVRVWQVDPRASAPVVSVLV